jgi:hypothetical protein
MGVMIHTIKLSHSEWSKLKAALITDYGLTTILISWKMRKQLGFTVREHQYFEKQPNGTNHYKEYICLDFWDPAMQTLFLIKYADFVKLPSRVANR